MARVRLHAVAVFLSVLTLVSCSEKPKTTQASTNSRGDVSSASTASDPVSGKTAFWEMSKSAHAWASDQTPLSLASKSMTGGKSEGGKAVVWTATFGSLRKREARTFSYAVSAQPPDIARGVTVGRGIPWGGPSQDALPFESSDLSVDSDMAYKTASIQAEGWLKKHPGKGVSLTLGHASRFPAPVWYVLWGDTKSGYAVFVNARTGAVIK